uniref:Uncharacterized protein n=1 Tax=Anguilla anguilla TaxID=7936 RepID=A0A0E9QY95_ANGAN
MIQMSNNARHFQTREYSYRYCRNGKSYLFYFLKRCISADHAMTCSVNLL